MIALSAFFSSSETALVTITQPKLRSLVDSGAKHAGTLEKVLADQGKMLSAILICNNVVNLSASALMTVTVQDLWGSSVVSIGTGVLTLLILLFGEISPKTMATLRAEKTALRNCTVIYALMVVLTPVSFLLNFLSRGVLRLYGIKKDETKGSLTEEEFLSIVEVGNEEGVIEDDEKELIDNVFDFSDKVAREIMVPRVNVTTISAGSSYDEVMEIFRENYFTRFPVYDENSDRIVGVINVKDLICLDTEPDETFSVSSVIREAGFTFEQKHLDELFLEMKKTHSQLMIVLDEYGMFAGIVTMEDLLEEIVGDIRDEYDSREAGEIEQGPDGEYLIHGHVSLDDVNDMLGTELESENYDSVGGLLTELLGHIPQEGESVVCGDVMLTAKEVDTTHVDVVSLRVTDESTAQAVSENYAGNNN